jgi:Flp pilus assembly pilin Flp
MHSVLIAVEHLLRNERGQDLIEYGLLVALIALAAVLAVGLVGTTVSATLWKPLAQSI